MSTPSKYQPFPNMTSRHLRMMVEWAIEHGVKLIDQYETELQRHKPHPSDQLYATKWVPQTRGQRVAELQKWLAQYGETYTMLREIRERLSQEEADRFGKEMADYIRSQK